MSTLVGIGSYYLALKVTNSFDILVTEEWPLLSLNILFLPLYLHYLLYFIPIMAFIFLLAWNLMDYILIKSHIIKEVVNKDNLILKPKSIITVVKNTFIWTSISTVILYLLVFFLMSGLGKSVESSIDKNDEKSFYTTYYTNDYNDSRIIFYNNEIEENSKAYLDANNDYALFKAFTQKEMGLKCIELLLIKHTDMDNVHTLRDAFSKNSRNKYVQTKPLIVKYKKNDNIFKNREGAYISSIIDPFSRFLKKNIPNRCEEEVSVEEMYKLFIPEYIKQREIVIATYKKSLTSNNSNYINKVIEDLTSWIEVIRMNDDM